MVGRDVANLAYLAPGVKLADSYDPTKNRYAILSVNGDGGRNVNVTVNGVDNKDNTVGGPVMQFPLEAVEEYQISTQRFSAENGRSEGAAINIITKRGGNRSTDPPSASSAIPALNTDEKDANGDGTSTPLASRLHPPAVRRLRRRPVKKDKAFLFFALDREREHQNLPETPTPSPNSLRPRPSLPRRHSSSPAPRFPSRSTSPAITAAPTGSSPPKKAPTSATPRRLTTA